MRPEWCPESVWVEATNTIHPAMTHATPIERSPLLMVQREGIARAILKERERCAAVAEGFPGWMQPRDVAKAIRNGTGYHHG